MFIVDFAEVGLAVADLDSLRSAQPTAVIERLAVGARWTIVELILSCHVSDETTSRKPASKLFIAKSSLFLCSPPEPRSLANARTARSMTHWSA